MDNARWDFAGNWMPYRDFEQQTKALKNYIVRRSEYLDEVEINDKNLAALTKSISERTALSLEINKAEREIYKDVEEHSSKMRGKGTKTIGDDGLSHLFSME